MVNGVGEITKSPIEAIEKSYESGVTDEFLKPIIISENNHLPVAKIENGDVVFCFNFRTDRGREITEVLSQKDFPDFDMHKLDLYYVTLTNYDETFQNVKVIFDKEVLSQTMGEVLEGAGKTQIRIAETEKYPHVTFFFSGGREKEFVGERRLLCPSPKDVPTYDLKPEMSAFDIRDAIVPELEKESADFICLNFANADMVGHTGVFEFKSQDGLMEYLEYWFKETEVSNWEGKVLKYLSENLDKYQEGYKLILIARLLDSPEHTGLWTATSYGEPVTEFPLRVFIRKI
jgi:2,3-bisphosphoglycerate-independent phosphoglycerate mutase